MAVADTTPTPNAAAADTASDYGSDIDEAALTDLLCRAEAQQARRPPAPDLVATSIEPADPGVQREPAHSRVRPAHSRSRTFVDAHGETFDALVYDGAVREPAVEVEYDERNRRSFTPVKPPAAGRGSSDPVDAGAVPDTRSPLQRFRSAPKKPLSVTDLVSPAWCELQYWYSLSKYGRVKQTPAMREGSKVHKVLEQQVHTEVPVEVVSREDAFGLRLWNVIQGLRTLRATGLTRELEVWGVVDGEVVNGVIDELSYTCPDEQAEVSVLAEQEAQSKLGSTGEKMEDKQQRLEQAFASQNPTPSQDADAWLGTLRPQRTLYIVDIKTRQSKSLPAPGPALRPTRIQLMLYHHLLSALAAAAVPPAAIFARYSLDAHAAFSAAFIAQIGALAFDDASAHPSEALRDSGPHTTLAALWTRMLAEFALTIPATARISPLLTAAFRTAADGALLGTRSFAADAAALSAYVADALRWWRGVRPARGVDIEDAFKCRICAFAPACEWRAAKVDEATRKARLRREARRRSEV